MSRSHKTFLRTQIADVDRIQQLAAPDSFMSRAWARRKESLEAELRSTPAVPETPKVALFFAGGASVIGSEGIDAQLAARVLDPYQEMVKTQFSANTHGPVGERGPRRGEENAKLFLTALPRGSFGLELSNPQVADAETSRALTDTLVQITRVIEGAGLSEEDFTSQLEGIAPRTLTRMRDFLDIIAKHHTDLTIETGELHCVLRQDQIATAKQRVDDTKTEEQSITLDGVLRGLLLDSGRFDFTKTTGDQISGRLSDTIEAPVANSWIPLINHSCRVQLSETIITTPGGHARHQYTLNAIETSQQALPPN